MNVAIEIGGTKLQIAIGDPATGVVSQLYRHEVDKSKGAPGILTQIESTLKQLPATPTAIGIGFGGPVDSQTGIIATSHQIGGWSGFALKKWVNERFDCPVFIENDANVAALGEAHFGAGRNHELVFYITLGSGVGGGMVVNGELYHGAKPGEAEIGLMILDRNGKNLESFCSGWALDATIRVAEPHLPHNSVLKNLLTQHPSGEAKCLLPAIQAEDPGALAILHAYTDTLAWGLSHAVHLFNPQVIILGGGVSLIGEDLSQRVQAALPKYLAKAFHPGPLIRLAELKEDAVLAGALCLLQKKPNQA
jgi:glucokinase